MNNGSTFGQDKKSKQNGLRRVPIESNEFMTNDADTLKSATVYSTNNSNEVNVEEQKQQLFGICEMIQIKVKIDSFYKLFKLKGILERINKLVRWTEIGNGDPKDLLDEYQQRAWPILVESDLEIKLLAHTIRQTIDGCNINEGCLDWLLAVHKFQVNILSFFYILKVSIEEMLDTLTCLINNDLERVLSLRIRAPGITGLTIKPETLQQLQTMQKEIRVKTFLI